MKSKLNSIELTLYFAIWITANVYVLQQLYEAQNELLGSRRKQNKTVNLELSSGWDILKRFQDVSDIEWNTWKFLIRTSWCYLVFQFIVSEIVRRTFPHCLRYWYIVSTVIFLVFFMSWKQLIIVALQPAMFAMILLFGGGRVSIWVTGTTVLLSYNLLKYRNLFWDFLDRENLPDEEVYVLVVGIAWVLLRCISYSIDYIEKTEKLTEAGTDSQLGFDDFINLLSYVFYLPCLYVGPIILYEDFMNSFNVTNGRLLPKIKSFCGEMLLYLLYTALLEWSLHYIYFLAMQADLQSLRTIPTMALCGGGLWMGLEFHIKYVIFYGTTSAFARLDNIDAPPIPRCIARIHIYSEMWRYFDVGLYKFLLRYIYKPCNRVIPMYLELPKPVSKLMASLATFIFIFMWHGFVRCIFVWSALNYFGITTENIGKSISQTEKYKWFKMNVLKSDRMESRFIAILCTPLLALSAISNFYLFAGDVGGLYFERFAHPSLLNFMIVTVSLYSCCHVSMALADVPSRTDVKKLNVKLS